MLGSGSQTPALHLLQPYAPINRDNMIGLMAASCGPRDYGRQTVYLLPKDRVVLGPQQVIARIEQDPTISPQLSLWDQRGSKVLFGEMLMLPVENTITYVQPLFLQAQSSAITELVGVVAVNGDRVVMGPTLGQALERLYPTPSTPTADAMRAAADPTARRLVTMNVDGLPPALTLPSELRNFVTFDPAQIVTHPENFPWDDSQRRQFLLEFFFRSAFFGEFTFAGHLRPLERAILVSALLGLPLMAFGVARELGDAHPIWPMVASAAVLLGAFVMYRMKFPFAPSQDFRYVTFLAVPLTFFAVRGAFDLPRLARPFGVATLATLGASCATFVLLVVYS
jgi:hypothetical protein